MLEDSALVMEELVACLQATRQCVKSSKDSLNDQRHLVRWQGKVDLDGKAKRWRLVHFLENLLLATSQAELPKFVGLT